MTRSSRTIRSRSSYLPRRRDRYSSKGNGGRGCSKTYRPSASRRVGSKLARSSYRSGDTDYDSKMSTYSSSGTGSYSDTSTSSYTTGSESYTSTDDLSSSFVSDTYDSNTSVTDESSDSVSDTEGDANTFTDESSYTIASSTEDSYKSTDGSSHTLSDGAYDSYDSTDESSDSFSKTDSPYETATEGTRGTERKALTISPKRGKSGYRADSHGSTDNSYYSDTGNTESDSYETSYTTSFSTSDYYNGKYEKRGRRF